MRALGAKILLRFRDAESIRRKPCMPECMIRTTLPLSSCAVVVCSAVPATLSA